ncbi:9100_t:CDS:1 [Ambispora gerdemannii]|uniref:9100_t:CDS:1 n=1 Tax=Ambispora gerdemannii TaxID=144530 RepID=A0A9N9BA75_9GLOM|nr:9100_t:CDS:1 [Ambispora gerdemannii]
MPVLIVSPDTVWVDQHGIAAYNAVMDHFATHGLAPNQRRDENSRCIFHFRTKAELYTVRDAIHNLAPNAFCIPPSLRAQHPNAQQVPVGIAWIVSKVGVRDSDFGEDVNFFHI